MLPTRESLTTWAKRRVGKEMKHSLSGRKGVVENFRIGTNGKGVWFKLKIPVPDKNGIGHEYRAEYRVPKIGDLGRAMMAERSEKREGKS